MTEINFDYGGFDIIYNTENNFAKKDKPDLKYLSILREQQQIMLFPNRISSPSAPHFLGPSRGIKGLAACKISLEL